MIVFYGEGRFGNQLFQYQALNHLAKPGERVLAWGLEDLESSLLLRGPKLTVLGRSRAAKLAAKFFVVACLLRPLARTLRLINHATEPRGGAEGNEPGGSMAVRRGLFSRITFVDGGHYQDAALWEPAFPTPLADVKEHLRAAARHYLAGTAAPAGAAGATGAPNGVARVAFVHVRRGDYLKFGQHGLASVALPMSYYESALRELERRIGRTRLVFVTDDARWVEDNFRGIEDKRVASFDTAMDFAIMTECQAGILSNSTFALGAAFFMRDPDLVIVPRYWFGFLKEIWSPPRIFAGHPKMLDVAVMVERFVTAFNGARDYYELPLALHELGRLEVHVADFYYPDALMGRSVGLPARLRNRHRAGLPSRRVRIGLEAAVRQYLLSVGKDRDPYLAVDRSLSRLAATVARRSDSHLFLHSQYAYWAFEALPDRRKFCINFIRTPRPSERCSRRITSCTPRFVGRSRTNSTRNPCICKDQNPERMAPRRRNRLRQLVHQALARAAGLPSGPHIGRSLRDIPASVGERLEAPEVCRFVFVGQGVQRKGLHLLLKAWRAAALERAELVVVARKMDPGIRPLLDHPTIRYWPGVDSQALAGLYAESAVFVMPSLVEGFGLVYLEALLRGSIASARPTVDCRISAFPMPA